MQRNGRDTATRNKLARSGNWPPQLVHRSDILAQFLTEIGANGQERMILAEGCGGGPSTGSALVVSPRERFRHNDGDDFGGPSE